jgi:hypothetical protein
MTYSMRRAVFVTFIAIVGGILGWYFSVVDWRASLPLGIFYALLVVNTFPSVRLFSSIIPQDNGKHALADILIAMTYVSLVISFGNPEQFALCALVLFLVAAGKYSLMVEETPHPNLVQRKVRVDLLGAFLCACVLAAMILGYPVFGAWALAIIFSLANVYVLGLRPLYRL